MRYYTIFLWTFQPIWLFFAFSDANFECWEKALAYRYTDAVYCVKLVVYDRRVANYCADVCYNNGRKRIYAESDSRFPDSVLIPPKRAWPHLWPSTDSDYVETVRRGASESIVFGHESPKKSTKVVKKRWRICSGPRVSEWKWLIIVFTKRVTKIRSRRKRVYRATHGDYIFGRVAQVSLLLRHKHFSLL